jgi:hypothetical protein
MLARTVRIAVVLMLASACSKPQEESPGGAQPEAPSGQAPVAAAAAPPTPTAPSGAKVFFIEPKEGVEISGPLVDGKVAVQVKMGTEGINVEKAGEQKQGSGHHHIIVDGEFVTMGTPVPKDETHLHYGAAQTEATLNLTPGEHTLTMQFADGAHMSYGPQLATSLKVKVVGTPAPAGAKPADAPR